MTRDDVHSNYSPTRTNTTMVSHRLLFLTVICGLLASKVFAQDEDPEESEEGNEPKGPPPEYVTLTVAGKTVKGIKAKGKDNDLEYLSFRGIRYAKAPVGDLRFKVRFFGIIAGGIEVSYIFVNVIF